MSEFQNHYAERSQTGKSNTMCCHFYKVLKETKPICSGGSQISGCRWQGVGKRLTVKGHVRELWDTNVLDLDWGHYMGVYTYQNS